jgi:hypothetical protein
MYILISSAIPYLLDPTCPADLFAMYNPPVLSFVHDRRRYCARYLRPPVVVRAVMTEVVLSPAAPEIDNNFDVRRISMRVTVK